MPIDLNADVGEEQGDDAALLPLVTSCNIACGGHAGGPETMKRTVELALRHGVAIGAHPGYADRANFGRVVVPLSAAAIGELVGGQLDAIAAVAAAAGATLRHVKPHGALYNLAARDEGVAAAIAGAVAAFDRRLILFGLAQSALTASGERAGLRVAHEAFVDRAYEADGSLRARTLPGAVFDDEARALDQAVALAAGLPIAAFDGSRLAIRADTLCIHGDTPHAPGFARLLRAALADAGIDLKAT
ncbi:MAG TPA: 5-oxoprolinase subunit PxpA [Herpetosiphonaceae bacterium]|nr:5-oxoprolinase subunit PxpA [Herpetosiphonaceae bacterium]